MANRHKHTVFCTPLKFTLWFGKNRTFFENKTISHVFKVNEFMAFSHFWAFRKILYSFFGCVSFRSPNSTSNFQLNTMQLNERTKNVLYVMMCNFGTDTVLFTSVFIFSLIEFSTKIQNAHVHLFTLSKQFISISTELNYFRRSFWQNWNGKNIKLDLSCSFTMRMFASMLLYFLSLKIAVNDNQKGYEKQSEKIMWKPKILFSFVEFLCRAGNHFDHVYFIFWFYFLHLFSGWTIVSQQTAGQQISSISSSAVILYTYFSFFFCYHWSEK